MSFIPENFDPSQLNGLNLAFVGDSVFDLFVRSRIVLSAQRPAKLLQQEAAKMVNAKAQARCLKHIENLLSKEEQNVCRWGKNAHVKHCPKNASIEDYHDATALEALFGYLYLSGNIERLELLADAAMEFLSKE